MAAHAGQSEAARAIEANIMMRWAVLACAVGASVAAATPTTIAIDTPMAAPRWARLMATDSHDEGRSQCDDRTVAEPDSVPPASSAESDAWSEVTAVAVPMKNRRREAGFFTFRPAATRLR